MNSSYHEYDRMNSSYHEYSSFYLHNIDCILIHSTEFDCIIDSYCIMILSIFVGHIIGLFNICRLHQNPFVVEICSCFCQCFESTNYFLLFECERHGRHGCSLSIVYCMIVLLFIVWSLYDRVAMMIVLLQWWSCCRCRFVLLSVTSVCCWISCTTTTFWIKVVLLLESVLYLTKDYLST